MTYQPVKSIEVRRMGYDTNGNHCVWVSVGGRRARAIQTNGNLPILHSTRKVEGQAVPELMDYLRKYHGYNV